MQCVHQRSVPDRDLYGDSGWRNISCSVHCMYGMHWRSVLFSGDTIVKYCEFDIAPLVPDRVFQHVCRNCGAKVVTWRKSVDRECMRVEKHVLSARIVPRPAPPPSVPFTPAAAEPPQLPVLPRNFTERVEICRECELHHEAQCWKSIDYGCPRKYRAAMHRAVELGDCPIGKFFREGEEVDVFSTNTRKIIFIFSGARFIDRLRLCERTWIQDAKEAGQGVVVVKPIDDPNWPVYRLIGRTLYVRAEDTIDSLPAQMQAVIAWALTRDDWDYLFKCDDDTYVSIPRFIKFNPRGRPYIGQRLAPGFGHGGAGYMFNRDAAKILLRDLWVGPGAKDRKVGDILRANGMPISRDGHFQGFRARGYPMQNNALITGHRQRFRQWMDAWRQSGLRGLTQLPPEAMPDRRKRLMMERRSILKTKRVLR